MPQPSAHSHEAVCEARRLIQLVEHHDDRLAVRLVEVLYETQHLHLMCHIEKACGLIEKEDFGILRNRHRNPCALALSAGHRTDRAVLELHHIRLRERPVDHLAILRRRTREKRGLVWCASVRYEFAHSQPLGCRRVLRQDGNRLRKRTRVCLVHIRAIEEHAPAEARLDAADGLEQGGLAAAVRADECRDLPLGDRQAQIVDDDDTLVTRLQMFYRLCSLMRTRTNGLRGTRPAHRRCCVPAQSCRCTPP